MKDQEQIKSVVFDLDGTLMMSSATIYKATIKTLEEFNITPNFTEDEFNGKIGHHFKNIFDDFKVDVSDIEYFIDRYKTYYFDFIDDSNFFPNVVEVLQTLKENKIPASILTTKAQDQADKIINHFGMRSYFTIIMGRQDGIKIKPAPDALLRICRQVGILPANTLMVGDSELDIKCGKAAGAQSCAVTFGYRNKEFLLNENPDFVVDDIRDLVAILKLD
ncbi:MAG: HAD family hydrolase [Ignavibacteriales bacterium]|nr:HAD family hydrolase [Ignavibacteriales bacterium]